MNVGRSVWMVSALFTAAVSLEAPSGCSGSQPSFSGDDGGSSGGSSGGASSGSGSSSGGSSSGSGGGSGSSSSSSSSGGSSSSGSGSTSGSSSGGSSSSGGGAMFRGSYGATPTGAGVACPSSRTLAWYLNDFTGNWQTATSANIAFGQPPKTNESAPNWTAGTDATHGNTIVVSYPPGSSSNSCFTSGACKVSGGFEFKVPLPLDGTSAPQSAFLSFWLNFGSNWSWGADSLAAGKLPGFCGGTCPTGTETANGNGYSARFMWRSGGGEVLAYAVSPTGSEGADIPTNNPPGGWSYAKSGWQHLGLEVDINTGANKDGAIKVWYNADPSSAPTFTHTGIQWYTNFPGGVGWFIFSTFYGGNSPSDGPPLTTSAQFADFQICY